jgi:hypothetical protein
MLRRLGEYALPQTPAIEEGRCQRENVGTGPSCVVAPEEGQGSFLRGEESGREETAPLEMQWA